MSSKDISNRISNSIALFPHQKEALPKLEDMETNGGKGGFLADAMGMGKTRLMGIHLVTKHIHRTMDLIVAPLSLVNNWKNELLYIHTTANLPHPKILIFHGKDRSREMRNGDWDYVITTYSILSQRQLNIYRWGRVVLDESHTIKNGLRKQPPKCAISAYAVSSHSKYNWCISGTPFNNRMKDIISQAKFIGTAPYNDPIWWNQKSGGKDEEKLREWRDKFVLRRTKEGILAPPNYHDITIEATRTERYLIREMRGRAHKKFLRWKKAEGLEKVMLQGQLLALIQKLRIYSNSYFCGERIMKEKKIKAKRILKKNAKVKAIIDKLGEWIRPENNSIVIFSQFTSFLDILEKVINKVYGDIQTMKFTGSMNKVERDDVIKRFTTDTKPRILLISLLAGGCGLTLLPCSTVFISEPYYNPFMEKQAEERVHRLGQKNQVNVVRFSVKNSVETWVNGLKSKKLYLASSLDLVSDISGDVPTEFSMEDLSDLFYDFVGFRDKEGKKDKKGEKIKKGKKEEKIKKGNIPKTPLPEDCCICLDKCYVEDSINLVCGHIHHRKCLEEWIRTKGENGEHADCPLCKREVEFVEYDMI